MTYKLANGKTWPEWEAEQGRNAEETAKWSEEALGQVALALLYDTIAVTDRAIVCLEKPLKSADDDDLAHQLKAGRLLFTFALGRVRISWRLLKEGYLFDAGGSLRVAWESILRGVYCLDDPNTARNYLNGQEISVQKARNAVAQSAEDISVGLERLKNEWDSLSSYSHSYMVEVIKLQTEVRKNGDTTTFHVIPWGVKRPRELLILFLQLLLTIRLIPTTLRDNSGIFEWPQDLVEEVDDVAQRLIQLEKQLTKRLEALDAPST